MKALRNHFDHPHCCPYCGGTDISGQSVTIDADTANQPVDCQACGRCWSDTYRLAALVDDHGRVHDRPATSGPTSTAAVEDRNVRQRGLVPSDQLAATRATVVGVGAIGRQVALQLAAMGVGHLQLIDHDVVEAANLAAQGYRDADLGRTKVQATGDLCRQLNPNLNVEEVPNRFRRSIEVGDAVFMCVDAIDTRRFIWQALRDRAAFLVDGRMNGETLRILTAADDPTRAHYPTTLFPAARAHTGPCTARSTIYTANIAAGLMVHQFTRHLRGRPVDADVMINLLAAEWVSMERA